MEVDDRLARAYARLTALKKTLEAVDRRYPQFQEKHVHEFHAALDHLAKLNYDVDEFRVPPEEVDHRETMSDPDGVTYSADRWVDREVLLTKLESVLTYFEIVTAKQKPQLGFHGPPR